MGKRGPKPGTYYGPRKKAKHHPIIRKYWREQKRKQLAKKRKKG